MEIDFMDTWILFKEAVSESCWTEIGARQEAVLNYSRSEAMTEILEKCPQKS